MRPPERGGRRGQPGMGGTEAFLVRHPGVLLNFFLAVRIMMQRVKKGIRFCNTFGYRSFDYTLPVTAIGKLPDQKGKVIFGEGGAFVVKKRLKSPAVRSRSPAKKKTASPSKVKRSPKHTKRSPGKSAGRASVRQQASLPSALK